MSDSYSPSRRSPSRCSACPSSVSGCFSPASWFSSRRESRESPLDPLCCDRRNFGLFASMVGGLGAGFPRSHHRSRRGGTTSDMRNFSRQHGQTRNLLNDRTAVEGCQDVNETDIWYLSVARGAFGSAG